MQNKFQPKKVTKGLFENRLILCKNYPHLASSNLQQSNQFYFRANVALVITMPENHTHIYASLMVLLALQFHLLFFITMGIGSSTLIVPKYVLTLQSELAGKNNDRLGALPPPTSV